MAKTCLFCGNKAFGYYSLCRECNEKKNNGEIEKCECGAWKETNKACPECGKGAPVIEKEQPVDITIEDTCIICGAESIGYHFCKSCYRKFSRKEVYLKITNCSQVEVIKNKYVGTRKCADGHIVKSKSENLIDDYLYRKGIPHAYEKALPIDENKDHDLHPDFCLENYLGPNQDVYIEHWGLENGSISYNEIEEYKLKQYKELEITVICTYEEDTNDIEASLSRKLNKKFIKPNQINWLKQ